jgi:hypothetical protein
MKRWQRWSLAAAVAAACACAAVVWEAGPERLWRSYLFAFLACWLLTMGGMGLLALGNLTGGRWAIVCRPFYLAATHTLPLVAIAVIPIAAFTEHIYPWVGDTPASFLPPAKAAYFETVFFCGRSVGYCLVWLVLSWWLSTVSRLDTPPASTPAMRRAGAISLVLLVPTATFAAFDWSMSLEPKWYSSIYGALASACGVLAAHALAIMSATSVGDDAVESILHRAGIRIDNSGERHLQAEAGRSLDRYGYVPPDHPLADVYNDLGNLQLAFLMVNTYFALSQFLIIWSGNLPSEITWYVRRLKDGWQWLALGVVIFHFVVPFLLLLSRDNKRDPRRLRRVALVLLIMYFVHLYWMIVPAFSDSGPAWLAANVAMLVALFSGWMLAYAWFASRCLGACDSRGPHVNG